MFYGEALSCIIAVKFVDFHVLQHFVWFQNRKWRKAFDGVFNKYFGAYIPYRYFGFCHSVMLMCNICSFYTYTRKWELPYLLLTYSLTTGRTWKHVFTYTSACIYRFFPAIFMRRHEPILSTRLVTVSLKFQKLGNKKCWQKCNFVGIKVKA